MSIISVVNVAFEALIWLIIIRVLLSWVRHNPSQPIIRFIYEVTEPILRPFRRLMSGRSPIDFSPILAFLAVHIARQIVLAILRSIL